VRRALLAVAVSLLAVGCASSSGAPQATPPLAREVLGLADGIERSHPDPFHSVSRTRLRAEADELAERAPTLSRDELVVGLMRLLALLGERDGHTAIWPRDTAHARPFNLYPIRLYAFPTGFHVLAATGHDELVGARVTAIDGMPVDDVVTRVAPLIPRDNEWSRLNLLPEWLVTAEVLAGVGATSATRRATYTFDDGTTLALDAVTASAYDSLGAFNELPPPPGKRRPLWLQRPGEEQFAVTIRGGRVVYAAYRVTRNASQLADRIERLALKPGVRRIVVDVRLNPGGDNTTYGALLGLLARPAIGRKTVVLEGRATFSAAGNFVAEVARRTRARLVGEPSGGAQSQWGDSTAIELPLTGVTAHVATLHQDFGPGVTTEPDVRVDLTAADFFAARDTVLERAIALP
jgi:hypothetical protein